MPGALTGSRGPLERRILGVAALIAATTIGVKLVAVGKEALVAATFGVGASLDTFFLAFAVPSFATTVFAGSFAVAFLPVYVRCLDRDRDDARRFLQSTLVIVAIALIVCAVLLALATPAILSVLSRGAPAPAPALVWTLAFVVPLQGLRIVFASALHAVGRFGFVAVAPVLTPLLIAAVLVAGAASVAALAWSVVAGSALELALLVAIARREDIAVRPRWSGSDSALRSMAGQYVPAAGAALLLGATPLIDRGMAARLEPGSVASLAFGAKLVALPVGIGAHALGTAVFPAFAAMFARAEHEALRRTVSRCVRSALLLAVPIAAGLAYWSEETVRLLFARGSFDAAAVASVSRVQVCFALQIPFHVAGVLLSRVLAVTSANRFLVCVNGLALVANIVLNVVLMDRLGVAGIALSTSGVYLFSFLAMSWGWSRGRRWEAA